MVRGMQEYGGCMNKIQCLLWLIGINIHIKDQCVPDFACCNKTKNRSKYRWIFTKAYFKGNEVIYMGMLMGFLGEAISNSTDKKVYIAGREEFN